MRTTSLFLLLALPCLATAQFFTETELDGIAANCVTGPPFSLSDCTDCVYTLGGPTSTIEVSGKAWACHGLCQNASVIAALTGSCESCIADPDTTIYGCQACVTAGATATSAPLCIACLNENPLLGAGVPADLDISGLSDAYYTACAACSKMTDVDARNQCFTCISTWDAIAQSAGGVIPKEEMATYFTRPNSFGTCVTLANITENINTGNYAGVTGIGANCLPGSTSLSAAECLECIDNVAGNNYAGQPSFLRKEFGCYAYCQRATSEPLADSCVECLESEYPQDGWACNNCLNPLFDNADCFSCVRDDPYRGRTSNFNWACGQCSSVSDPDLRELCFTCIRSQPLPDFNDINAAATGIFNLTTEANICNCVDLTLNSTIAINRPLDAMERACFEPHVYYDENNNLQTPDIPWGNETNSAGTTSACLGCLAVASANGPSQGLNKKYGCTEYCQNPDLVSDEVQGEACATCVAHPLVADPSGCKMCMEASDDNNVRGICYACVEAPTQYDNHAWGCSQCAQMGNPAVFDACFQCLALGEDDPCACVDKAKNGTLTGGGVQTGCEPNLFRVWVWVKPSSTFGSVEWSLDTVNPMGPRSTGPGVTLASGTSTSTYLIFKNNVGVPQGGPGWNVYGVNLPFNATLPIPETPDYIWLSLFKAVSSTGGLSEIFWDWSQTTNGIMEGVKWLGEDTFPQFEYTTSQTPNKLAYQLIDSCGGILVDTITRTPYNNSDYTATAVPVYEANSTFSYGISSNFAVPEDPITPYVVTVYKHCMGVPFDNNSLGWSFRLVPGTYNQAALQGIQPDANEASSYLVTVPGWKLELYKNADCTGTFITVTQIICLEPNYAPSGYGAPDPSWNDAVRCVKVLPAPLDALP